MPIRIVAGKNKYGNEKVFHLPVQLVDARNRVIYEEWKIKNRFRDSQEVPLLTSKNEGAHRGKRGIVLGPNGKPIPPLITTLFTSAELKEAVAKIRAEQASKQINWSPRRLRNAGLTLGQLEAIKTQTNFTEGQKVVWAIQRLVKDPFFGTALMTGKLVIPENASLSLAVVTTLAQDYFLKAYKDEKRSRETQYEQSERQTLAHVKDILPASRWTRP